MLLTLNPLTHIDAFALGSLLAIQFTDKDKAAPGTIATLAGSAGFTGIALSLFFLMWTNNTTFVDAYRMLGNKSYYLTNPVTGNIFLYISLVFYWLIYYLCQKDASASRTQVSKNALEKLFVYLGDQSYVLYLFHYPIVTVLRYIWANWLFLLIAGGVVTAISAVIYNKWIEPFLEKLGGKNI